MDLSDEIKYRFSRSSGKGGQNVNKVNTKVELRFNVYTSRVLTAEEKEKILRALKTRINQDGELILTCQSTRSQLKNKDLVYTLLCKLLEQALKKSKLRIATRKSRSAIARQRKNKEHQSAKKTRRRKKFDEE